MKVQRENLERGVLRFKLRLKFHRAEHSVQRRHHRHRYILTSTMALNQEASAFKAALARQDYTSWHSQPPPLKAEDAEYTESPKKKAKKAKSSLPFLPLLSLKDIAVLIIGNYRRCIFPTCRYWDRNKCEHAASISRV